MVPRNSSEALRFAFIGFKNLPCTARPQKTRNNLSNNKLQKNRSAIMKDSGIYQTFEVVNFSESFFF